MQKENFIHRYLESEELSELAEATFKGENFDGMDFRGALLYRPTFINCSMKNMNCNSVYLMSATFIDCDLSGSDMRHANLRHSRFVNTKVLPTDYDNWMHTDLRDSDTDITGIIGWHKKFSDNVKMNICTKIDTQYLSELACRAMIAETKKENGSRGNWHYSRANCGLPPMEKDHKTYHSIEQLQKIIKGIMQCEKELL